MSTSFDRLLGREQGGLVPQHAPPRSMGAGLYAFVLGSDRAGDVQTLAAGDKVRLTQTLAAADAAVFFQGVLRIPATRPTRGLSLSAPATSSDVLLADIGIDATWRVNWGIDAELQGSLVLTPGRKLRLEDLLIDTSIVAACDFWVELQLGNAVNANVLIDVELPGVYFDFFTVSAVRGGSAFNFNPQRGEVGVPRGTNIAFTIVDLDAAPAANLGGQVQLASPVLGALSTVVSLSTDDLYTPTFAVGYGGPASSVTASGKRHTITIDPTTDFASEDVVSVAGGATWVGGSVLLSYAFTIADYTAPQLVNAQSTGHRTVRVVFNEPMGASALVPANYNFVPLEFPAVYPAVLTVARDTDYAVIATLDEDISPRVGYRLTVTGAADTSANVIGGPPNNQVNFAGYACPTPTGRRFNLFARMPGMNQRADASGTGDLKKFLACLQEPTDLLLCDIDAFADILDPDLAPEAFVDRMLADLGNPFDFDLSLADKRRLIRVLVPLYKQKGTEPGLKNAIRFFMNFEVVVLPYGGEGLVLGESALGEDWVLGVSRARAIYSFDINTNRALTAIERSRLISITNYMKRVGTHLVNVIETGAPPAIIDHLELGESELGDTEWQLH